MIRKVKAKQGTTLGGRVVDLQCPTAHVVWVYDESRGVYFDYPVVQYNDQKPSYFLAKITEITEEREMYDKHCI